MPAVTDGRSTRLDSSRRDLRSILADGVAFSVMIGLGETYVPAFALAVGVSEVAAGWIVSLPMLVGAVLQLASPWAVRALGSHRLWVVGCAIVQTLVFLAYGIGAFLGAVPTWMLFLVAALYWGAGLATGPAWNTWVGSLIPRRVRAAFFASRSRIAQGAVLVGLVAGGLSLQWGRDNQQLLSVFGVIFIGAAVARAVSTVFLFRQSEPNVEFETHRSVKFSEWINRLRHNADGRLLVYMLVVQAAVQISGPFFTPYMLSQLRFSYAEYLALISTSFAAKMIVLPTIGVWVRRIGPQRMLYLAGFGIIPLAALWIVSDSIVWLLCVQILSGTIWAVYELCTFLLLFDHIPERERTSVLTTFNLANATAIVGGSLLGGILLGVLGHDHNAYLVLFGLSSSVRVVSVFFLLRLRTKSFRLLTLAVRTLGVRPNTGSLDAPIVTAIERNGAQAEPQEKTVESEERAPAAPG